MKSFALVRPTNTAAASLALQGPGLAVLKANGTDLLDRLKERLLEPDRVVSLADVPRTPAIAATPEGPTFLDAGVTLHALAESALVRAQHPTLAQAAGLAASPQVRRRATLGGNLAQHTRCGYYRHASFPCLKRGAEVCPVRAAGAVQDTAGVFGNELCASAHPSSVAPVLGSLEVVVQVMNTREIRQVPFEALWATPQRGRTSDLALGADDVIVSVSVPLWAGSAFGYEEVRAKAAFDWALASAAVRLDLEGRKVTSASVWLGSAAPTPWRARAAEAALVGLSLGSGDALEKQADKVGEAAVKGATPLLGNAFKIPLIRVAVKRALLAAARRS